MAIALRAYRPRSFRRLSASLRGRPGASRSARARAALGPRAVDEDARGPSLVEGDRAPSGGCLPAENQHGHRPTRRGRRSAEEHTPPTPRNAVVNGVQIHSEKPHEDRESGRACALPFHLLLPGLSSTGREHDPRDDANHGEERGDARARGRDRERESGGYRQRKRQQHGGRRTGCPGQNAPPHSSAAPPRTRRTPGDMLAVEG
jgi:hypothetical protein